MKTAMKKSLVLIGIALFFVLTAWAQHIIYAWDKGVSEIEYCEHGFFVNKGETDTKVYGYCYCEQGWWGQRCEFSEE